MLRCVGGDCENNVKYVWTVVDCIKCAENCCEDSVKCGGSCCRVDVKYAEYYINYTGSQKKVVCAGVLTINTYPLYFEPLNTNLTSILL